MSNLVITIGRQCGSRGKTIGKKVAEALGVKCYDKELLTEAAKHSGLCEELFETHDEKPTNSFLYSLVMDTILWAIRHLHTWICRSIIRFSWHSSTRSRNWQIRSPA